MNIHNQPQIEILKIKGTWTEIYNSAMTTIGKSAGNTVPNDSWKLKILKAEHSPIRQMFIHAKIINVPYWVTVHFVRHKIGIEHWIKSQRSDRTGINRDDKPQSEFVTWEFLANYQAMINISRKRLCGKASGETRNIWEIIITSIFSLDKSLYYSCAPECIYRGFCPEFSSCGYYNTDNYHEDLNLYRSIPSRRG